MTELQKFRKKAAVEVHAIQFDGTGRSHVEVEEWAEELIRQGLAHRPDERPGGCSVFMGDCYGLYVHTLAGEMHAAPGDFVVCEVNGEFYPCKPDIFEQTYERVGGA